MIVSGYFNNHFTRSMFFIQLVFICSWMQFSFGVPGLVTELTNQADFGICTSSFSKLPSMQVHVERAWPSEQVCITQDSSLGACSQDEPYDNNQACIAVYYLKKYNVPLFAAFRIRATRDRPLNVNQRIYRADCENRSGGWQYEAFRTDGRDKKACTILPDSWRFSFEGAPNVYNKGHLVPCGLGKRIGLAMGAATFNMYNAGPQRVEVNEALARLEANLIDYATETCLNTRDVITGNVVRDFYFISGTVPDVSLEKKWINREGAWKWEDNWAPSKGSNVPAFAWTAGCCLLTFPEQNRRFSIRVSYYIENEPGKAGRYVDLSDLKYYLNVVYNHRFNRWVGIDNIFGDGACDKPYNYRDVSDILAKHYDSELNNVQKLYREVEEAMEFLRPKYPFISDFPYKPPQQK